MSNQQLARRRAKPRGVAAVEFAVVLPFIVILVLGGIEISRAVMVQHTLQEAAQAGCRVYSVGSQTKQDARDIIATAMENASLEGYRVEFTPSSESQILDQMQLVRVKVMVDYSDVAWSSPWFFKGAALSGECVLPADLSN